MTRGFLSLAMLGALLLLWVSVCSATFHRPTVGVSFYRPSLSHEKSPAFPALRGGATKMDDDEDESEDESEEEEEEQEEIVVMDDDEEESETESSPSLVSSTVKASIEKGKEPLAASTVQSTLKKARKKVQKEKAAVKEEVKTKLSKTTTNKRGMSFRFVPYIVRVMFQPPVLWRMTKAYWKSLVDLDYVKKKVDTSQDLRSALQQKAKKGGGGSKPSGRRKQKRGQAKTLSDLPALNT